MLKHATPEETEAIRIYLEARQRSEKETDLFWEATHSLYLMSFHNRRDPLTLLARVGNRDVLVREDNSGGRLGISVEETEPQPGLTEATEKGQP